ncbi:MAG: FISUMP domain-containing protein, partial [Bacteroidales bacterium]|nr:FISUMP domain-containing protein [Bacteroidales bacterium]
GSFTTRITMLNANTTYYIRAYAISSAGVAYGDQMTFRTNRACNGIDYFVHEGQNYNTMEIGNQCWMRENLNSGRYIPNVSSTANHSEMSRNNVVEKYCYDNNTENCVLYGGLYDWNEMMRYSYQEGSQGICPDGWHVPTLSEWNTLISFYGGETVAGTPLKKAGASRFDILAGGMRTANGNFSLLGSGGYFWVSTQIDETNAWGIALLFRGTSISPTSRERTNALSVRCIKN